MDLLQNCESCYGTQLSEYPATLVIKAGLTSGTGYIVKVIDKFFNKYSAPSVNAAGDGSLTVSVPNTFPKGWFSRDSGSYQVEISEQAIPWTPVTLTFGAQTYDCVEVEFVNDGSDINVIE